MTMTINSQSPPARRSTKAEVMERVIKGELIETFFHETLGGFNVTALRKMCKAFRLQSQQFVFKGAVATNAGVEGNIWDWLFSQRDVDLARAKSLTPDQLIDPAIIIDIPEGINGEGATTLIVDGIHRIYERRRRNKPNFFAYVIPLEFAPRAPDNCKEIQWGEKQIVKGKLIKVEDTNQ